MTGDKKPKKRILRDMPPELLETRDPADGKSHEEIWVLLEGHIVDFYCSKTGVKKESVTPEIRRALCGGYSFCSGYYGSELMTNPMSIATYMRPEGLILSANWVIENRLKKPIGN